MDLFNNSKCTIPPLRKPQEEAIKKAFKRLEKGVTSQIITLPTGVGKTMLSASLMMHFNKVLFICSGEELIFQSYRNLSVTGKTRGVVKAERFEIDNEIIVASTETIHRRLDRIRPDLFDLVIYDECHLAASRTSVKTLEYFQPKLLIGLTATPHRADGASLGNIFDEISYEYSMLDAVKDGYLCEIDAIRVKTDVDLDSVKTLAGDFNQGQLKNAVNNVARNNLIVDSYEKYCKGRQGIVFCVDVQHAIDVSQTFNRRGYDRVSFVVGDKEKCPDRKERITKFKKGEIPILTNCEILTTGFDHPDVGWIGMACPTKSLTKYIQAIGRGARLKSKEYIDKFGQNVKVLDFVDVTSRHRVVNCWELDKVKPIEERTFISEEKRDKLLEAREGRNATIDRMTQQDEFVDLLKLPKVTISKSPKMKEPATDKQLAFLKSLGYDIQDKYFSKYDASVLISNEQATRKQINALKFYGYDVSKGVTIAEASLAFEQIKKKKDKKDKEDSFKEGPAF